MCYTLKVGFEIFGHHIAYYGIIIASALMIGVILCDFLCLNRSYDSNIPYVLALIIVPLAIIGARLYYIIFSDSLTISSNISVAPDTNTFKVVFSSIGTGVEIDEITPTKTPTTIEALLSSLAVAKTIIPEPIEAEISSINDFDIFL